MGVLLVAEWHSLAGPIGTTFARSTAGETIHRMSPTMSRSLQTQSQMQRPANWTSRELKASLLPLLLLLQLQLEFLLQAKWRDTSGSSSTSLMFKALRMRALKLVLLMKNLWPKIIRSSKSMKNNGVDANDNPIAPQPPPVPAPPPPLFDGHIAYKANKDGEKELRVDVTVNTAYSTLAKMVAIVVFVAGIGLGFYWGCTMKINSYYPLTSNSIRL